jgi:hypothetical protein
VTIRFAVYPGYVTSKNDWDRHYIGARELMRLYGASPAECVVVDFDCPETYRGRNLDSLMALRPMSGVDYRPVTEAERMRYPLGLRS